MKKFITCISLLSFICFPEVLWGQAVIQVTGRVTSNTNHPVHGAIISLIQKKDSTIHIFTMSDRGGYYQLKAQIPFTADSYLVSVNNINFSSKQQVLTSGNEQIDFHLDSIVPSLPKVIVHNSAKPLRKSGDTLHYQVDSFLEVHDRSIGDVLKRLPGIVVDDKGKIAYNGKPIFNLYIDGDNLLDDKYNIATKSIRADMVSRVQVIENDQPIKILQGNSLSDNVSLNLKLKENAKLKAMGEADLGLGNNGQDLSSTQMLFRGKIKAINKLNYDNIGIDSKDEIIQHNVFTDYKKYEYVPSATLLNATATPPPDLGKDRYLFNNAKLLNLNNLYKTDKGLHLRVNLSGYWDKQPQQFASFSTFYFPSDTVVLNEAQFSEKKLAEWSAQLTLTDNKTTHYLNNVFQFQSAVLNQSSQMTTSSKSLSQYLRRRNTAFSNEFSLLKKLHTGAIVEITSILKTSRTPEYLNTEPGIGEALVNNNLPYNSFTQSVNLPTLFSNTAVSIQSLGNHLKQSYKLGYLFQSQHLSSGMNFDIPGSYNTDSLTNSLHWKRSIPYLRADYLITNPSWQLGISLPLSINELSSENRVNKSYFTGNRYMFTPSTQLKIFLGTENYINITAQRIQRQGQITDSYSGFIFQNFQLLSASKISDPFTNTNQLSAGFTGKNTARLAFYNFSFTISNGKINYINAIHFKSGVQIKEILPYSNDTKSRSFAAGISKYSFLLHTNFSLNASIQSTVSNFIQNGNLYPYESKYLTISLKLNNHIAGWLKLTTMGSYYNNETHLDNSPVRPGTTQLYLKEEVTISPTLNLFFQYNIESFSFRDYQLNNNRTNLLSDILFSYRSKKGKTDYSFSVTNIGNIDSYHNTATSLNNTFTSDYWIRPRLFMIKTVFNF